MANSFIEYSTDYERATSIGKTIGRQELVDGQILSILEEIKFELEEMDEVTFDLQVEAAWEIMNRRKVAVSLESLKKILKGTDLDMAERLLGFLRNRLAH